MDIRIDPHTLERAAQRGATEAEIRDVIETGEPLPARHGRVGKFDMCSMENGRFAMQILYDVGKDLLYIRLDDQKQPAINRRLSDEVVLDVGDGERIIGIEILDASKHLNLDQLLPVNYQVVPATAR